MKKTFTIAGQIFTADIHKEGNDYVSKCIEVPVSDFGSSQESALINLAETTNEHFKAFPRDNPI